MRLEADGKTVFEIIDGSMGRVVAEFTLASEAAEHVRSKQGRWTTQPPTEPGWYWFAPYEGPVDVVEVFKVRNGNELLATDHVATYALKEMAGTWFSEPLSVPGANGGEGK